MKSMGKVSFIIKRRNTRDNFIKESFKDMEYFLMAKEMFIKDNLKITRKTGKDNLF